MATINKTPKKAVKSTAKTKKTTEKGLETTEKVSKKLTDYEQNKAIEEISKSINRNIALKLLYNRVYGNK